MGKIEEARKLIENAPLPYDGEGEFQFDNYEISSEPQVHHRENEKGELELWFGPHGAIVLTKNGWRVKWEEGR